ncbi:pyridine nucleotide-disulfide oxidoreductase [Rhodococcus sp. PAMC28707]|uniref:NAD(P)/FAD-dependent oxidoreductase n=1 Tax=unclassified Rhodococcus (in: high G+C Gram-positive bacteria) TaxID=192944 RepID=UPI00109E3386|nr:MULTISPECIES: FAD-dependent oxidoreductase [unclassified Rhodococcus (in: high G+C Gram-positive bacteria)]QCB52012.1 pyridine nucleotide-disulfide oxidoreductase [Rhodococcus sp. PAMC28705]QCB59820.1 pyridine nucleotide-disulfide oxidoreductase [Rhodococcus sp. PAMC28707]
MASKIVILGAGYAGISAAHRLSRRGVDADVTMVNPRDQFIERIRLHQYMSGTYTAATRLDSILPASTELKVDAAESIDIHTRRIQLSGGALDYDYLIYAVGSHSRTEAIPGSATNAVTIGTFEPAQRARSRLQQLPPRSTVTVIGGGLTGIETAAELAESTGHNIRLISDQQLAPTVSERGRRRLYTHLIDAGVEIIDNTAVVGIGAGSVELSGGTRLTSDLTVDVAAFGVPDLAERSGLNTDSRGALTVDDNLISTSSSTVIGAGDAAAISSSPLRMSCQAAIPTGVHAAETVLRLAAGTTPKQLRPKFAGQCISLGRRDGLLQLTNSADVPRSRAMLTGRQAALIKEQICSSTMWFGHRGPFSYSWS